MNEMGNVLVIKLGALGDIVFADGALRDIRAHHPNARITLLTRRGFVPLMQRCPWVDAVIADDNAPRWRLDRMLALRAKLEAGQFHRIYDLQNSRRTRFYRRWLSPRGATWSWAPANAPKECAVALRHAQQLQAAGLTADHAERPSPRWVADRVDALLADAGIRDPFVVLLPGSSARHLHKRWPHFPALSHRLAGRGVSVVTIPGIDEPGLGAAFAGIILKTGQRVLNLHELAGALSAATVVVGNDSGPTHLAACLGARCVALFEATSPARTSTGIDERDAICLAATPLASLPVEAVEAAVMAQLSRAASGSPGLDSRLPAYSAASNSVNPPQKVE